MRNRGEVVMPREAGYSPDFYCITTSPAFHLFQSADNPAACTCPVQSNHSERRMVTWIKRASLGVDQNRRIIAVAAAHLLVKIYVELKSNHPIHTHDGAPYTPSPQQVLQCFRLCVFGWIVNAPTNARIWHIYALYCTRITSPKIILYKWMIFWPVPIHKSATHPKWCETTVLQKSTKLIKL